MGATYGTLNFGKSRNVTEFLRSFPLLPRRDAKVDESGSSVKEHIRDLLNSCPHRSLADIAHVPWEEEEEGNPQTFQLPHIRLRSRERRKFPRVHQRRNIRKFPGGASVLKRGPARSRTRLLSSGSDAKPRPRTFLPRTLRPLSCKVSAFNGGNTATGSLALAPPPPTGPRHSVRKHLTTPASLRIPGPAPLLRGVPAPFPSADARNCDCAAAGSLTRSLRPRPFGWRDAPAPTYCLRPLLHGDSQATHAWLLLRRLLECSGSDFRRRRADGDGVFPLLSYVEVVAREGGGRRPSPSSSPRCRAVRVRAVSCRNPERPQLHLPAASPRLPVVFRALTELQNLEAPVPPPQTRVLSTCGHIFNYKHHLRRYEAKLHRIYQFQNIRFEEMDRAAKFEVEYKSNLEEQPTSEDKWFCQFQHSSTYFATVYDKLKFSNLFVCEASILSGVIMAHSGSEETRTDLLERYLAPKMEE
ncbi:hypothetical protein chiPu_0020286 [Chiloscyllium punctatum]|uniref:Uncharacterized protein n=1 Tax=Chiloscyllium punctatum TaxID=137246 RepID=A0A401RUM5_CHIPU|nr:hypothetical protein [Chiloscyllium punctatum]